MTNSLLLNNFVHERPTSSRVKPESGRVSRTSLNLDLSFSRQSSELQSTRDTSSRLANKLKSKLLHDSERNSVASQNLEADEDISVSDLEDDYVDERFGSKANNYWTNLENSIKKINDYNDQYALKPRPKFRSSDVFKDVMTEMSGNAEYSLSKGYTLLKQKISRLTDATSLTALALSQATKGTNEIEEEEIKKEDERDDEIKEVINQEDKEKELVSAVAGAKRAWRVLKTYVTETGVEHRTTTVKMNWEALRHHVAGITDLDKARQDLYERYGFLPTVQEDGTKVCRNVMWLNRTRAQIMQNETDKILRSKLRTKSARPFTAHEFQRNRSLSGNSSKTSTKRPVSCDLSNGVSHLRLRPSSEKQSRTCLRSTSVKSTKVS